MRGPLILAALLAVQTAATAPAAAQPIRREAAAGAPIANSVEVPPGRRLIWVSGTVPEVADPSAPPGSPQRYGDTETQTRSVLRQIGERLARHGAAYGDIVMMRVFLVAPPGEARMDFAGMMRAYRALFGAPGGIADLPARSTMQVAGLVDPGWLVEIEVTAAAPPEAGRRARR